MRPELKQRPEGRLWGMLKAWEKTPSAKAQPYQGQRTEIPFGTGERMKKTRNCLMKLEKASLMNPDRVVYGFYHAIYALIYEDPLGSMSTCKTL